MMFAPKSKIFIVGAKRTPFGGFGGKLKELSATQLGVLSAEAALKDANVAPEKVDEVVYGNVNQSSLDAAYLARHVGLKVGVPISTPALTINRLCGSGFEAVCLGAEAIELKRARIALCGGSENMSQSPMVMNGIKARWGTGLGQGIKLEDSLWSALTDSHSGTPMGITAENVANRFDVTREESDEYALRSQTLWNQANEQGIFKAEICPVEVKVKRNMETVDTDEHPRPATKIENLTKLKPTFKSDGVVTAGSASGICDGAASLVVAGEDTVNSEGLEPLSRLVAWSRVGCEPTEMGLGPVGAIQEVITAASLTMADVDIFEINEAFAAQYIGCEKALGLDRSKTNLNGGAIALGHPLAASGARILAHLSHELKRTGKRWAVGAACIGGGQGIAVLLENAN